MPILLYTTEYRHPISPENFKSLIDRLPEDLRLRALRYYRWQDAYGFVFGKLLLKAALKELNFPVNLEKLQYSSHNKPFFSGGPHFNISHSGNRVVCAVSRERMVGIDIEYITDDISILDYQAQFTSVEWKAICSSAGPKERLFQFWTAKESLVKADGRGLDISLQELDVHVGQVVSLGDKSWDLKKLSGFSGYAGHIAVENYPITDEAMRCESGSPAVTDFEVHEFSSIGFPAYF